MQVRVNEIGNIYGVFLFREVLFITWRLSLEELYNVRFAYFTTLSWCSEQYFTTMTDSQKVSHTHELALGDVVPYLPLFS